MSPSASVVILGLLLALGSAAQGTDIIAAVVNRDLDGSVVVSGDSNYDPTAAACAAQCRSTTGCNLWVFCGNPEGCTTGQSGDYQRDLRRYRQCWLKYDTPRPGFPYWKNQRSQASGFISGTTVNGTTETLGTDVAYGDCVCKPMWNQTVDGTTRYFQGVCANPSGGYYAECDVVRSTCPLGASTRSCSSQSCNAMVGADLDGTIIMSGNDNYKKSAEECCWQCAMTKGCQVWVWCSDPQGCGAGGLSSYRQCWLKQGDPRSPSPKPNAAPGWISGVRMAFLDSA